MLAASMDIGGSKTIIGIVNAKGNVIIKRQVPTQLLDYKAHFLNCIELLNECLEEASLEQSNLLGLGISLPGMVNPAKGILYLAPFAGWKDIHVEEYFQNHTKIESIYVENDVNACAIGEMYFGNTSGNFLWITISTGIGGAIVANNKLVLGESNCAGEIGHIKVEYNHAHRCSCGQYGCLEAHGSGTAITRMFGELVEKDNRYIKFLKEEALACDASGCAFLAKAGDEKCIEIFKTAGTYLGRALSYAVNLLNPKEIFIGGGVSRSFDLIEGEVLSQIHKNTIMQCSQIVIKTTALGYEAALLGAAAIVFQKKNTSLF